MDVYMNSVQHDGTASCCRKCANSPKALWISKLGAKKAEHGYSEREVGRYVAELELKYADAPQSAFEGR